MATRSSTHIRRLWDDILAAVGENEAAQEAVRILSQDRKRLQDLLHRARQRYQDTKLDLKLLRDPHPPKRTPEGYEVPRMTQAARALVRRNEERAKAESEGLADITYFDTARSASAANHHDPSPAD